MNLPVADGNGVKITDVISDAIDGNELDPNDYPDFFATEIKQVVGGTVTITLGDSPVLVETINANTDLDGDGEVNFVDFAMFAQDWLKTGSNLDADFDDNDKVDFEDLKVFTDN